MKKLILGFINNKDSVRNSKLITALYMIFIFTVCTFLVMFGIPPTESVHVGTVLWVQGGIITGALGINAIETYRSMKSKDPME
jgi:hypothetical protein